MAPSADDIQNKRFLTALRGYDKDEVHAYLQEIAAHVRKLEEALASPPPADDVIGVENTGEHVAALLRQAADAADEMLRGAAEDSRLIRAKAERAAQRLVEEMEHRRSLTRWGASRWHRAPPS
jgi:DivIVA domain-containing protein